MSSQQKKDLHNRRKVSYILKSTSTHCNMEPKHAAGKRKHLIFTMTPCKLPLNRNFLNFIFSKNSDLFPHVEYIYFNDRQKKFTSWLRDHEKDQSSNENCLWSFWPVFIKNEKV